MFLSSHQLSFTDHEKKNQNMFVFWYSNQFEENRIVWIKAIYSSSHHLFEVKKSISKFGTILIKPNKIKEPALFGSKTNRSKYWHTFRIKSNTYKKNKKAVVLELKQTIQTIRTVWIKANNSKNM